MSPPDVTLEHGNEHPEEVYVRKQFHLLQYRLQQLPLDSRARLQGRFTQELIDQTVTIDTPRGPLSFVTLGKGAAGRALSLLRKQPATITWIDSFRPNGVLWDIGANVGAYSLYAALRADTRVVAFEPAAVNYFILCANCEANRLEERVECLLVGIGSERTVARLEVSQFVAAQSFSFRGKRHKPWTGRQAALIMSIDQLVEEYGLVVPNYIKIDVPGLTESIVAGATRTLQRPEIHELHIEMAEGSAAGQRIAQLLARNGFAIVGRHSHGGSTDLTFVRQGA
jgi:FkbM family methyltransferase